MTVGGWAQPGASDATPRYSARPTLAEVVLGGQTVPLKLESKGDNSADTDYQGLSLLPGEFPLNIRVATAPPGTPQNRAAALPPRGVGG